jgi:hypothetical protein
MSVTVINGDFYKDNAYEFEFYVSRKNTNSGLPEPATGLSDLSGWASGTDGGAEIHADVKIAATERSGRPGYYFGIIPGSAITARLFPSSGTTYAGKPVYLRFVGTAQNINISLPRHALEVRRAA